MQALFILFLLGNASRVTGTNWKEEQEASSTFMHSTNILEHTLVFLEGTLNEHVTMNLVPLG